MPDGPAQLAGTGRHGGVARPRVQASWVRSQRYGVSPEAVEAVFTDAVPTDSLFYECGAEVLEHLHGTLVNEPVGLMITDAEGLVLARWSGDSDINRSLDRVHLAPGFYFGERTAGTNGLALALADRVPSLVRAGEHFVAPLRRYTCAAVPVLDSRTGSLVGSINMTTWSDASSDLLLALAQSAAGNTSALMHVRAGGHPVRPMPRGEVFHVFADRLPGADPCPSRAWRDAVAAARQAVTAGRLLAVVGEPGAGKAAVATLARHGGRRRERVLVARPPAAVDVDSWLALWAPELSARDTCVVVSGADALPAWAADDLAAVLSAAQPGVVRPAVLTAPSFAAVPEPLAAVVDAVVEVPALRHRPEDVEPLARSFARELRHRDVQFTPRAVRALAGYAWPENVRELRSVVREAVARTDVGHLRPAVLSSGSRSLTRLEQLERDEILRCLTHPGTTVLQAATELGLSRATLYRKIAQYGLRVAGRGGEPTEA
ncbi:regulatory protein, Fis family [Modestobacter sp. DSM 44400]|nr:regulatory protein, Fis family [Modestobacter sp. DSM 44400]